MDKGKITDIEIGLIKYLDIKLKLDDALIENLGEEKYVEEKFLNNLNMVYMLRKSFILYNEMYGDIITICESYDIESDTIIEFIEFGIITSDTFEKFKNFYNNFIYTIVLSDVNEYQKYLIDTDIERYNNYLDVLEIEPV